MEWNDYAHLCRELVALKNYCLGLAFFNVIIIALVIGVLAYVAK